MSDFLSKFGHDLLRNGYQIVPITPGWKYPMGVTGWQKMQIDQAQLDRLLTNGHAKSGVGVLTGDIVAVDLDIRDKDTCDKISTWCLEHLGVAPQRTGESPKTLFVFRSDAPLSKRSTTKYEDPLGEEHQIEILGKGNQFVAYAIHPDTRKPYVWNNLPLASVRAGDLPVITEMQIDELFEYFEENVPDDWVIFKKGSSSKSASSGTAEAMEDAQDKMGYTPDQIKECLDYVAEHALYRIADYDGWIRCGKGIWYETDGTDDGFLLWDGISQKDDLYASNRPCEMRHKWKTFEPDKPGKAVTFATVVRWAYDAGWDGPTKPIIIGDITPTRWDWVHPTTIPRREWIYGRHLIRKYVSVTIAPGGVGKSRLLAAEALAMVTGRSFLGATTQKRRVWLWNLEDGMDELNRCIAAACQHYGITASDIGDRLCIDSGRQQELCTAKTGRNGVEVLEPVYQAITDALRTNKIDVLIVDPFVSSHRVPENDNGMIDAVVKRWARVAEDANCAIELVHHTRKENGNEITAESSRGGSAIASAARDVRVLNRMTSSEAEKFGVENHRQFFRVQSDKANLAPIEGANWFHIESIDLLNGSEELDSDSVGVISKWEPPDAFANVTDDMKQAALTRISDGDCRYSPQAEGWAGCVVDTIFGLNGNNDRDKSKLKRILKTWETEGFIAKVKQTDPTSRKLAPYFKLTAQGEQFAQPPQKQGGASGAE